MSFLKQTWTLTKKDLLLIGRRNWFFTLLRALILPIVVTTIISLVRIFMAGNGLYGVGEASPLLSLSDAFDAAGGARSKFVIVDNNLQGDDVQSIVDQLSTAARDGKRDVHVLHDASQLTAYCPSSSKGVTECFAAVEFWSSPDTGANALWNFTLWQDGIIGSSVNVKSKRNDAQVYTLPLLHTINAMIANSHDGPGLPQTILQYPFTSYSQDAKDIEERQAFQSLVVGALAFAFFFGLCGITYHLTGHITHQREIGMLQLIDAMMPNKRRWECLVARTLSAHLAFDIIYAPGWIVMGVIAATVAFPHQPVGWFILLYILTGLALTSYSMLASSLFRREQLSAISAIIAAIVFAIVAQWALGTIYSTSVSVMLTSILFAPCAFIFFLFDVSFFEAAAQALRINDQPPHNYFWANGSATGSFFLGVLVFQIVVYPIIGAIIEKYLHGNSSRSRHLRSKSEMGDNAVRLTGFTKHYNFVARKRDRVQAVKDLTLNLLTGSITVLLGSNGSGKSTTLNAIAGLETITSGQIEIDGTGGIGLCPQKNVHWAAMSVAEHVLFFEQLKRPSMSKSQSRLESQRLVRGCDLEPKSSARAKTLSGGQMRKLQLAMMLAGGSRVCCIDEASSGIDPLARRKIWDILLKERGERTMLLTTHFLDEAQILSDHVALLSKGRLRAEGSVVSLTSSFGKGYRIIVPDHPNAPVLQQLPASVTESRDYNSIVFNTSDTSALVPLIAQLECHGITDYRIRGPTIDDVFLGLAEEMRVDDREAGELVTVQPPKLGSRDLHTATVPVSSTGAMKLNTGKGCSPFKQTLILFLKRLTVLRHNPMAYVGAMFVPLVLAGLVTRFMINKGAPLCQKPGAVFTYPPYEVTIYDIAEYSIFGPPEEASKSTLKELIPKADFYTTAEDQPKVHWQGSKSVDTLAELNFAVQHIDPNAYYYGGFFVGQTNSTLAWQAEDYGGPFSAVTIMAAMDMILSNMTMAISMQQFSEPYAPNDFYQGIVAIFVVLGFAVYPGLFALYPTAERLRNVRAMQYSNGVKSSALWIAYSVFDFIFILLISVVTVLMWDFQYDGWDGLGYLFLILVLYGIAATAYSYVISLVVPSQLSAIAATSLVQVVIAMLFFVGYFVTIDTALATDIYSHFDYIYYTMGLICPAVNLFRALLISLNVYALACNGSSKATNLGQIGLFGTPILYLILQSLVLIAFLIYWESGRSLEIFGIRSNRRKREEVRDIANTARHQDAVEDEKHLAGSNDGLRVFNVSKSFGANKAVDDMSFGILPSEKLALLGPNGAGKSTMISLIRGQLHPDSMNPPGTIYIASDSLKHSPVAAKNHLGVCPQFDAVDAMTLSENLHFYARARGVPDKDNNIRELISCLDLSEHSNKMVRKLSGGTKRKLSLAIALIANPSVLLLDEPSSGMDAAAKRALWSTLSTISAGRCLLLTTHSMEEADALCDRAGIMASEMLALGTIPDLCAQHGDNIYIHLVHENAPYTSAAETEALWRWVKSTFQVAEAEQRTFGGQLRFAMPIQSQRNDLIDGSNMGRLFRIIEENKHAMGIRDYSIGPTTLDQVFLNVVSRHNVQEENTQSADSEKRTSNRLLRRSARK